MSLRRENLFRARRREESSRSGKSSGTEYHHHVYVVLLDEAAGRLPSVIRENPARDPGKACLYVGMTGLDPYERFENHKNGIKSAYVVRKFGLRLLPEWFEHLNPMPFDSAVVMERELAEDLRAQGYTVAGGH